MSLVDGGRHEFYTSPVCLAIAFYFAEKKHKAKAKEKIWSLSHYVEVAEATKGSVKNALQNPAVNDFEDGLEYYTALENKCKCIITDDVEDFYFSEIEVLSSQAFFMKYVTGKWRMMN